MKKLPSDREILRSIYDMYASDFENFSNAKTTRETRIYVPIDITKIANTLETDPHVLFGRLYYHLDQKYRYKQDNGSYVNLFAFNVGQERHCIHYPYLAAILSEKNVEHRRNLWAIGLSILSLAISVASIVVNILTRK